MSSDYNNIKLGVGMSLEMKVRVYASNSAENFHVTPDNALGVGEFTSSNPAVAEVTKNGVVTAKATGNAVITFKTINGKSCTATVTVYDEPLQVKLNYTKLSIAEGATAQLTATFDDYAMGL